MATTTTQATELARAPAEPASGSASRPYYLEIFLVSVVGLLLEISYTRVVSYKLFYYFTYLVIGLALLGLGAGGVLVAISNSVRRASSDTVLGWALSLGSGIIAAGYIIIAVAHVNTADIWLYTASSWANAAMVLLFCVLLFASFVPIGVVLSTLFGRRPSGIGRLYFFDLAGAAIACAIAVPLMASVGPPTTIMASAVVMALAGLRIAFRVNRLLQVFAVIFLVLTAASLLSPRLLPDVRVDVGKAPSSVRVGKPLYSSWSPVFRVDVRSWWGDTRALFHDGLLGSTMLHWNGKTSSLAQFQFQHNFVSLPFAALPSAPQNELIIGAAAGHEVVTSLYYKAHHIDAIELNPVTYKLVTKTMANYDGHLASKPGVHYVNADGRSYLARTDKRYQLIWYPAPDSYSATNASSASAYVLSESYLYTTNAVRDSLKHLATGGVLVNQFGDPGVGAKSSTRTARYVATARKALSQLGVQDASSHILVTVTPSSPFPPLTTTYVSRTPFTDAQVAAIQRAMRGVPNTQSLYLPTGNNDPSSLNTLINGSKSSVASFSRSYPYSVSATSDDKPFFFHFSSFGTQLHDFTQPIQGSNFESGVGERVLMLLLAFAVILSAIFLLLPFLTIRKTWRVLPRKGRSALYFCAIGFGFMLFEVTLIQKLVLFLGYPTYSLTVTLCSLLIFVGLGALLSSRFQPRGPATPVVLAVIAGITAYYLWGLGPTTNALLDLAIGLRVVIAFLLVAPLGLSLGLFMPLGVRAVAGLSPHEREYVAWAWALNGFASVVASVLGTMLAMTYGFHTVLVVALLAYCIAVLTLRTLVGTKAPLPAG